MNRKLFRTIFLPGVIFLFSVLVLGQSAWACDEPARECYEQLDIKWVDVDLVGNWIYIWGEHFDNGGPPVVTLGGIHLGDIRSDEEWIVAKLPSVPKDIPYGQYGLRVSTGDGHKCKDKYSVKIHPAPPEKPPCEPTCPEKCPQECKGEKGDPGPEGPQGPPGISGWEKVVGVPVGDTATLMIKPSVSCTGSKKVLGGGFRCSQDYRIIESSPLAGDNGWQVTAIYMGGTSETTFCQAFALCAEIK